MTLPLSGAISLSQVNTELGRSATANISLGEIAVRTLFGVPSGAISMSQGYGKSSGPSYTFTTNTADATLNVTTLAGYVAGSSNITITVNSGVYLYATSIGNAGLTLTGGTTGDTLTLINNGFIMGKGGNGVLYTDSGQSTISQAAQAGGPALSLGYNTTVTNTSGYIGGGGGCGGGESVTGKGAGGAGGGNASGYVGGTYALGGSPGSAGGTIAGNGGYSGGGGRILPGTGGAGGYFDSTSVDGSANGAGGGAGGGGGTFSFTAKGVTTVANGGGGGWGASGGTAYMGSTGGPMQGGAGGSAGASGGNGSVPSGSVGGAGTAGGKAVALNGKTITWTGGTASSSRAYGAVS